MGVVNVTPDSFSDGGQFLDPQRAIEHGRELVADGADVLDIGGESTRPGAAAVGEEEELARVAPVIEGLAGERVPISIDTSKLAVAEAALDAGASIVNDVTALRAEPRIAGLCSDRDAELVLMHMQGSPRTMQEDPTYDDVVDDVKAFLAERMEFATAGGGARGADLARPRDRVRKDGRAQPRAAAPPAGADRAGTAAGGRYLAQELHRQDQRRRGRTSGSAARSPAARSPSPTGRRCCASTTCARCARGCRSRGRFSPPRARRFGGRARPCRLPSGPGSRA